MKRSVPHAQKSRGEFAAPCKSGGLQMLPKARTKHRMSPAMHLRSSKLSRGRSRDTVEFETGSDSGNSESRSSCSLCHRQRHRYKRFSFFEPKLEQVPSFLMATFRIMDGWYFSCSSISISCCHFVDEVLFVAASSAFGWISFWVNQFFYLLPRNYITFKKLL